MFFLLPKIFYNLFWLPSRIIFNFFFHFKIESKTDLKRLKGPLVLTSNHASWVDPFLIGAAFPFAAQIFPIRYACWYKYFYFPLFFPFILSFGAFPIKKGLGLEKALVAPIKILKNRGVVGFFPEGKRRRIGEELPKPKRGAAYLALATNSEILPIKIEGNIGMSFFKFLLRQYTTKIKIGERFSLPPQKVEKPEDLNQTSNFIMSKIREL